MKKNGLDNFLGQYVSILSKSYISMTTLTGEAEITKKVPVLMEGYFVSYDDKLIFLGTEKGKISKFVRIEEIVDGEIIEKNASIKKLGMDDVFEQQEEEFDLAEETPGGEAKIKETKDRGFH